MLHIFQWLFCVVLLGLSFTAHTMAHNKSLSFSDWVWQGRTLALSFIVPMRDATLLPAIESAPSLERALATHLAASLRVQQNNTSCRLENEFVPHTAAAGYLAVKARYLCFSENTPIAITNHAFFNYASSHVHFARFRLSTQITGGEEILLNATQRRFTLHISEDGTLTQNGSGVFGTYLWLGITHIATGLDHIAFLLCLLLLAHTLTLQARALRQTFLLITGFTIGHSLTLALVALDIANPHPATVEAIIGLSVAVVAAETILARMRLMPVIGFAAVPILFAVAGFAYVGGNNLPLAAWAGLMLFCLCYGLLIREAADARRFALIFTALFGLVHGFGFGGLLLDIGLPRGQTLTALFGFNIGVELGQIAIIALIIGATLLVRHAMATYPPARFIALPTFNSTNNIAGRDIVACLLTAYGVFLFIQRSLL